MCVCVCVAGCTVITHSPPTLALGHKEASAEVSISHVAFLTTLLMVCVVVHLGSRWSVRA